MAAKNPEKTSELEQAAEDLFNYAIDREDVKWLMARLPEAAAASRTRVEYELPILKIVSVGWSISYYLADSVRKDPLLEYYWRAVFSFSQSLSETTELMIGREIDYFEILRKRLDAYVGAMADHPEAEEPARVIGPVFAEHCGDADDLFAFMTGSKMFLSVLERVRQYLDALQYR